FLTFLYTMAISMNLINPAIEPTEKVMIWAAFNVMPKLVGVLVLTGIMAAGLSSASTFLSVSGFSATNDVFKFKFRDDKHQLWSSRWIMLGISIIALILAYFNPPAIRILSWFASTIIAASWGPVAFASIWSDKITEKGAFWGMLMGFLGQIGAESLTRFTDMSLTGFFHPFFIGVYLNLIAIYLGSKSSTVTEVEKTYLARMRVIPEAELFAKDYKIDKLYAKILMSAGVLIAVLLVVLWAVPVMNA
ncbi:MAG TPA: sodium:solute symporter family protein, partial [Clostridia bacterium]|nr:sodium:solute symporter family protein [Clostridia bacterium]